MRRAGLVVLVVGLAVASIAVAAERDPDYDAVLRAYKTKQWTALDRLAPAFVKEKPDHQFAHSVRFMLADSYRQRKWVFEAAQAFREYLRLHPTATLADRSRGALIEVLNTDARHAEALREAEAYLKVYPDAKAAPLVRYERARALEDLHRFEEAATAYAEVEGSRAEAAAYRIGVARFRARAFPEARMALRSLLARYPESRYRRSAEDYLFRTDTGFKEVKDGVVGDYDGKYVDDPRLAAVRKTISARRKRALAEIVRVLGRPVPRTFLVRFEDAGNDQSGRFALTRLEVVGGEARHVVILRTEYVVLDAFDLDRTLVHELYHAVQRHHLGEAHFEAPKWLREGTALYVAGQAESRSRLLAGEVGRRPEVVDPLKRLVNGLGGRHALDDYAEDVAAFESAAERHGRDKVRKLLLRLLETTDVEKAVREVLGEDLATFERHAGEWARLVLEPLVIPGRVALLRALAHSREREWAQVLETLPGDPGAYEPIVVYYRARALHETGESKEALRVIRKEYLPRFRRYATFVDNVTWLEVKCLKALESEEYEAALARARKDLTPTGIYSTFVREFGASSPQAGMPDR